MDPLLCTKEHPLHMDLRALGYAFAVADGAARLLNQILDKQSIAETARTLASDLYELRMRLVDCYDDNAFIAYSSAFLEVDFAHVEMTIETRSQRLTLWSDEEEEPAE